MSSRSEILFNYRQAIKQADKLDEIARKIEKLATDKMGNTLGTLKSAWQSDNAPQYYNKVGQVQSDIKLDSGKLRKVAQSIRTTAESIKRAELRALEIAKSRTYRNS